MLDYFGKDISALKNKKLYLFDMDGTLYLGNVLFEGVNQLLNTIKGNGGRSMFITNNPSKSTKDYVKKLKNLGINAKEEDFFTSAQASAILIKEAFGNQLIYVQGTRSFVKGLKKMGVNLTTEYSDKAKAILVSFDTELTFDKLVTTTKMLKKDIPYYATNPDWVCPTEFGYVLDCGSMCFGLEKASGRQPVYIGKPKPEMVYSAIKIANVKKEDVVVIGDRIYTDIASGYNAGVDTVLVLSGEATIKDYEESAIKPSFVLNSVKDLL